MTPVRLDNSILSTAETAIAIGNPACTAEVRVPTGPAFAFLSALLLVHESKSSTLRIVCDKRF